MDVGKVKEFFENEDLGMGDQLGDEGLARFAGGGLAEDEELISGFGADHMFEHK